MDERLDQGTSSIVRRVVIFNQLSEGALEDVISALKPRDLAAGEVLFHQGAPGEELILVASGTISIYVPVPGHPDRGQPIRLFKPGDVMGEMALIDHKPRSLSARALRARSALPPRGPPRCARS